MKAQAQPTPQVPQVGIGSPSCQRRTTDNGPEVALCCWRLWPPAHRMWQLGLGAAGTAV
jgi:hypothetical protein